MDRHILRDNIEYVETCAFLPSRGGGDPFAQRFCTRNPSVTFPFVFDDPPHNFLPGASLPVWHIRACDAAARGAGRM